MILKLKLFKTKLIKIKYFKYNEKKIKSTTLKNINCYKNIFYNTFIVLLALIIYAAVCKHAHPCAPNQSNLSIGSNQTLIIAQPHIGGDDQTTVLGAAWWIFELCNRQSGGARQTPVKCQFNMSDWPGKRGEQKIII